MRHEDKRSLLQKLVEFIHPGPDSKDELIETLADAEDNEVINAESRVMLEGVIRIADMTAGDVMVAVPRMDALDIQAPYDELLHKVIETAHSRFPVHEGERENIIGIPLAIPDPSLRSVCLSEAWHHLKGWPADELHEHPVMLDFAHSDDLFTDKQAYVGWTVLGPGMAALPAKSMATRRGHDRRRPCQGLPRPLRHLAGDDCLRAVAITVSKRFGNQALDMPFLRTSLRDHFARCRDLRAGRGFSPRRIAGAGRCGALSAKDRGRIRGHL